MLSEEEKKAIKYFYNLRGTIDESYMLFDEEINLKCGIEMIKQITIFLNLIAKLKKENKEKDKYIKNSENITTEMSNDINKLLLEIKEKDKQIDLMARAFKQDDVRSVEEIKKYFEKQEKEKGENSDNH